MFRLYKLAFRNIFKKRLRSILTISGIAISVASVIVISTVGAVGGMQINTELDSLGINGISVVGKNLMLKNNAIEDIKHLDGVSDVMPLITCPGEAILGNVKNRVIVWGIDKEANNIISLQTVHGRQISEVDVKAKRKVCLIDENTANNSFKRGNVVGKTLTLSVGIFKEELTIIGVVKQGSDLLNSVMGEVIPNFIYVPYTALQDISGMDYLDSIAIKTSTEDIEAVQSSIVKSLDRQNGVSDSVEAKNLTKQRDRLTSLLDIITIVLSAISAISLLVAGLGIMTVMLVSVGERTKEIGIKKSIGAKRTTIMFEFLFEALTVSITGSIIGGIIGVSLTKTTGKFLNIIVPINISNIILLIFIAIITGIIFGVYPAYKASKLRPVDALRND